MAARVRLLPVGETTGHLVDTLRVLVGRELRMRYKGSALGIIWAVISPLGTVVILQYLFTKILVAPEPHFAAFMYSALLPWVWFSAALQGGATTLAENRGLIATPFFSKPILPWVVTCTNFMLYLLALPVLLALIIANGVPLKPTLVALPAVWIVQWILTLGLTVLIAAIGVLVRDIRHLIGVILVFWFYLTPIFYDLNRIPPDAARWLRFNPMSTVVAAHRAVTIEGRFPDWLPLLYLAAISTGVLFLGLMIFHKLEDAFIEEA
jgi:lipopolysaccharide transport system permease protein